jgi:hypothetical protein
MAVRFFIEEAQLFELRPSPAHILGETIVRR